MELRHLRYFVAVAEEGSLTVAAVKRLHTAQPSLSRQLRALEQEVGTQLFSPRRSRYRIDAGRPSLSRSRQTSARGRPRRRGRKQGGPPVQRRRSFRSASPMVRGRTGCHASPRCWAAICWASSLVELQATRTPDAPIVAQLGDPHAPADRSDCVPFPDTHLCLSQNPDDLLRRVSFPYHSLVSQSRMKIAGFALSVWSQFRGEGQGGSGRACRICRESTEVANPHVR